MISPVLELLKKINEGVIIYEPFRRDAQGMQEFQDIVHRLQEMERQGLIGRLFIQKRMGVSVEYIDMVMVQNGLTVEGKRLLAEHERRSQSN